MLMNKQRIILQNDRLKVAIVPPGEGYVGSRFDWTGWVEQVELDGAHTFGSTELKEISYNHGFGLCNEFGIEYPIGYDDCPVGGTFPKLGVGLLTRPNDEPYDFFQPYAVQPFPLEVEQTETSVRFTQTPLPCRGYEAVLIKTLTLAGTELRIDYELTNVGTNSIDTIEYNHNFVSMDKRAIGPGYRLTVPFDPDAITPWPDSIHADEQGVEWPRPVEKVFYTRLDAPEDGDEVLSPAGSCWRLEHEATGAGMQETLHAPLFRFALWGMPHVISPEQFVRIRLEPGETMKWSREYTFFSDPH
ncbi:hypothetical protein [Gorillibacterium massiliense]|uniref:hypothetical protein n=1 Tax=Gorillibacterium massiliense TaxID=1280390 RepID=UPI0004AD1FA0|nr:hypothetical protein [Gorillibacterium massiliense]